MLRPLLLAGTLFFGLSAGAQTTETPDWAPDPAIPFQETRALEFDLLHTQLDLRFDWEKEHVLGTAVLTFTPWAYPQSTVHLDAVGMEIHSIALKANAKEVPTPEFTNDGRLLHISLGSSYKKGDELVLTLRYTAKPTETPGKAGTVAGDKGLFFIDPREEDPDKPTQIWTQGEVQNNSRWFPTFDQPNQSCTQELTVTVPQKYVTLSNGRQISSTNNSDGTRTDFWKQDKPHAPYLFALIVGEYAVVKDSWRGKEVSYYVEPAYGPYARGIFPHTPEMLEFFSNRLGVEYPWDKYSQVIVRDFVAGAMENTTAVTFTEFYQLDGRELVDGSGESTVAHELFHHWFGDLVTCESWPNLPLNESFANYSEYLWYEYKYGIEEADRHYDQERAGYLRESENKREALIRYHVADPELMFDAHSYNKGGRVLHMLRRELGDDVFFAGLKLYLERNRYSDVEIDELRIAMEDASGRDLMWFFDQWFLKLGHPELAVSYAIDEPQNGTQKVALAVTQTQDLRYHPVYRIPLRVHIQQSGKDYYYPILLTEKEQTFDLVHSPDPGATGGRIDFVDLDPEHYLLGTVEETGKTPAHYLAQYTGGHYYLQRRNALVKLEELANDSSESLTEAEQLAFAQALHTALRHSFWGDRQDALTRLGELSGSFRALKAYDPSALETTVIGLITSDSKSSVRREALEMLIDLGVNKKNQKAYQQTIAKAAQDSSYTVSGVALVALSGLDPKAAEVKARQLLLEPQGKQKDFAARTLLKIGTPGAIDQVHNYIETWEGSNELIGFVVDTYGTYAKEAAPAAQTTALEYLKKLAKNYERSLYHRASAVIALVEHFGDQEDIKSFVRSCRDEETDPRLKNFYMNQYGNL